MLEWAGSQTSSVAATLAVLVVALIFAALRVFGGDSGGGGGAAVAGKGDAGGQPAPTGPPKKLRPDELRDFTPAELAKFRGEGGAPIYIAVLGSVFDMSSHPSGPGFYGPGSPYHCFAGRDATCGLGAMKLDVKEFEAMRHGDLKEEELDTAREWADKFKTKYVVVGRLVAAEGKKSK